MYTSRVGTACIFLARLYFEPNLKVCCWSGPKIQDLNFIPNATGLSLKPSLCCWAFTQKNGDVGPWHSFYFLSAKESYYKNMAARFCLLLKKNLFVFRKDTSLSPSPLQHVIYHCFWDTKVALTVKIGPNGIHVLFNGCWIKVALKLCIFKVSCFIPIRAAEAGRKECDILALCYTLPWPFSNSGRLQTNLIIHFNDSTGKGLALTQWWGSLDRAEQKQSKTPKRKLPME